MVIPAANITLPAAKGNPLRDFSLRGQAEALDQQAVLAKPLLGSFCLTGQGTVLSAPPNAGKTLFTISMLVAAIEGGRISGDDVYYIDADDTTQGVAEKVKLLDEYDVHVIAEGHNGFRAAFLAPSLEKMIDDGTAREKFIILDTFKKFTSPMSKVETSAFTDVLRRFVLSDGTLLCLAHTNKNMDSKGRNVFAGVSDIIDDLDCAYVLDVKPDVDGKRVVQFTNKKRRGNNPDAITMTYSADADLSYLERITSVQETNDYGASESIGNDARVDDEDILESLKLAIHHGEEHRGKMELVQMVAPIHNVSKQRVLKLLEKFTGDDPARHRWLYIVGERGRHIFRLLDAAPSNAA